MKTVFKIMIYIKEEALLYLEAIFRGVFQSWNVGLRNGV
jgi:hypothetical protein